MHLVEGVKQQFVSSRIHRGSLDTGHSHLRVPSRRRRPDGVELKTSVADDHNLAVANSRPRLKTPFGTQFAAHGRQRSDQATLPRELVAHAVGGALGANTLLAPAGKKPGPGRPRYAIDAGTQRSIQEACKQRGLSSECTEVIISQVVKHRVTSDTTALCAYLQNAKQLQARYGPAPVNTWITRYPAIIRVHSSQVQHRILKLSEMLGCPPEEIIRITMKYPMLLTVDSVRYRKRFDALVNFLDKPQEVVAHTILSIPALLASRSVTLEEKWHLLRSYSNTHRDWKDSMSSSSLKSCLLMLTYSIKRFTRFEYLIHHHQQSTMSFFAVLQWSDAKFKERYPSYQPETQQGSQG